MRAAQGGRRVARTSAGGARARTASVHGRYFFVPRESTHMAQHDAPGAPAGERLLREIAEREQELQRRVAEARAEAARLIEQAQREADGLRAEADAARIRQEAERRRRQAVDLVVGQVLGGAP